MAMDAEKRERIINAAMREFCKGYKNASTDEMVKEAGISKGLLFHYFGSKEKLYQFVLSDTADLMNKEFLNLINFEQGDVLDRIWQITLLKMDLSNKYPLLFDFGAAAYVTEKDNPKSEFASIFKEIQRGIAAKIFDNIDESVFKDGIDIQKAVNVIWWSLMGYANAQIETAEPQTWANYREEYSRYLKDIEEYFKLFKKIFYKENTV